MRTRKRLLILTLVVLVIATACNDKTLQTVAKALNDTATAVSVFQTSVINANAQKLISDADTANLLRVAIRVNLAGQQAVQVTRNLQSLGAADRTNLLAILEPVIGVLADAQTNAILNITDLKTRQNIQAAILVIQTALSVAQLALATANGG